MRKVLALILSIAAVLIMAPTANATHDPQGFPNNKYGIHVIDTSDIQEAAELVNSNGGEWGYVTIVITEEDRTINKWQQTFDEMRRLKLIPIVRIATKSENGIWQKPSLDDIDNWVNFLNSLNWVIKNRYVIIANEPNHAKEWGGQVNPEEYAAYLKTFSIKLKEKNPDFYVLPAGFDASAPTAYTNHRTGELSMLDQEVYMKRMKTHVPDVFDHIDGWTSHSYPNPAFSGPTSGIGRGSVKTYEWELELLKKLGIKHDLPVFITETGWAQAIEGYEKGVSEEEVAQRLKYAFENVWNTERVVAVTPFILNYPAFPFANFSWKDDKGVHYKVFGSIKDIKKIKGEPVQVNDGEITSLFLFPVQISGKKLTGFAVVKNTGQSIWTKDNIQLKDHDIELNVTGATFDSLEPGQRGAIYFEGKAPETSGIYVVGINLSKDGEKFGNQFEVKFISENPFRSVLFGVFDKLTELFDSR